MDAGAADDLQALTRSSAYVREVLRSERQRVTWLLLGVGVILALSVARNVTFFWGQHLALIGLGLAAAFVLFELLQLAGVTRRLRAGGTPSNWLWGVTSLVEAAWPSLSLLVMIASPAVGLQAFGYPVLSLYFIVLLLTTLRLQPWLCLLAGGTSAAGYLAAALWALYGRGGSAAGGDGAMHPTIYVTFAVMLAVAGAAAGGVAGQLRGRLVVALREAEARRRSELRSRETLIFALAKLAECRDTDTGTHLERIAAYVEILAEALRSRQPELDPAWIEQLRVTSSLHDIGKVALPDAVLRKPGPLTPAERGIMQQHPEMGAAALRAIRVRQGEDGLLRLSEEIAAGHHERWDGTGYPAGTAGAAIPLAARIVALADVYDALTSPRVYKPPLSHAEACAVIRAGDGTHFDPVLVSAFFGVASRFDAVRAAHAAAETTPAAEPRAPQSASQRP